MFLNHVPAALLSHVNCGYKNVAWDRGVEVIEAFICFPPRACEFSVLKSAVFLLSFHQSLSLIQLLLFDSS